MSAAATDIDTQLLVIGGGLAGFAAALDFAGIEYTGAIDAILRDALKP